MGTGTKLSTPLRELGLLRPQGPSQFVSFRERPFNSPEGIRITETLLLMACGGHTRPFNSPEGIRITETDNRR